ncbi:glutamic-type intramembrane protease PrsW [Fervidibacillus halotolerans]|uniref:Protease PrsW n=1 Tax=Fervidibacillus halotolerans TaxID=2980027 RepID=A0A9E8M1K6_9BACI|nr:glutamic-type intramembrane protease PrsW [Fervidibacillus halotolerans]WAA13780.1 glutamic-type intramembrane protease PrsW [Fervidibacillus halotolerans]
MLALISAGIAPGFALLSYFYLKDEYETEPVFDVLRVFFLGTILVFPIMFLQYVLETEGIFTNGIMKAFLSAAMLEEFFKWFILYFTVYKLVHFDEHYDGIVYGASLSLGFATAENILYLFANGLGVAFGRALLPVSSHALFGVIMGYYMGKAKFSTSQKERWIWISLLFPILLHGIYDLIILMDSNWFQLIVPFMIYLWWLGLRKVKKAKLIKQRIYEDRFFSKDLNI